MRDVFNAVLSRFAAVWLVRALIAAVVFAQASVALHACELPSQGYRAALLMDGEAPLDPPCHGESPRHAGSPNVCAAHCTASDQANSGSSSQVPQPPDVAVLTLAPVPEPVERDGVRRARPSCCQTGPPLAIRFQVLRI